jgi:flavin-dependent dehydrogenase
MSWETIAIAAVSALGGGGIGAAAVSALANRPITEAEADRIQGQTEQAQRDGLIAGLERALELSHGREDRYEERMKRLEQRAVNLEMESATTRQAMASLREENEVLNRRVTQLTSEVERYRRENAGLLEQLAAYQEEMNHGR